MLATLARCSDSSSSSISLSASSTLEIIGLDSSLASDDMLSASYSDSVSAIYNTSHTTVYYTQSLIWTCICW